MHRPVSRLTALLAGIAGLAGCSGSPERPRPESRALAPCNAAARGAVSRAARATAVHARTTGVSTGQATCVYEARRLRVDVMLDANPQASVRFDRAVVERDQVAVWSGHHERAPRLLHGIGQGADWFPADREVLATDGRRLVSVTLLHSSLPARSALRLGKEVARVTLGQAR